MPHKLAKEDTEAKRVRLQKRRESNKKTIIRVAWKAISEYEKLQKGNAETTNKHDSRAKLLRQHMTELREAENPEQHAEQNV